MTDQHPITPPLELVQELLGMPQARAIEAAFRAGADQELEACCEWLESEPDPGHVDLLRSCATALRAVRRPKPPSLKKQACDALDAYVYGNPDHNDKQNTYNAIRRALEALSDD